jgi:hypothetical protein
MPEKRLAGLRTHYSYVTVTISVQQWMEELTGYITTEIIDGDMPVADAIAYFNREFGWRSGYRLVQEVWSGCRVDLAASKS